MPYPDDDLEVDQEITEVCPVRDYPSSRRVPPVRLDGEQPEAEPPTPRLEIVPPAPRESDATVSTIPAPPSVAIIPGGRWSTFWLCFGEWLRGLWRAFWRWPS